MRYVVFGLTTIVVGWLAFLLGRLGSEWIYKLYKRSRLTRPRPRPHAWIQWKGTDVCMDVHCKCGESMHFDGDFCYYIKCPVCGQVYECDGHIQLHPVPFEPENTQVPTDVIGKESASRIEI